MIKSLANTGCRNRNVPIAFGADAALFEAVELLDPDDRFLIVQLYFEEREETAVAARLGITLPSICQRKAEALSNLGSILGPLLRRTRCARRARRGLVTTSDS